jgi:biotin carboxyl carrier protein
VKLLVNVDGKPGELNFETSGNEFTFEYRREGGAPVMREASLIEVEPGIFSILFNGRSYDARVVSLAEGHAVRLNGQTSIVEVRDPRAITRKGRAGSGEGLQKIASPMPGKVVRVLVAKGDMVDAGAGLVVVEAMKMQNEMKSPKAGRVVSVTAREGATVAAGEILAEIE